MYQQFHLDFMIEERERYRGKRDSERGREKQTQRESDREHI